MRYGCCRYQLFRCMALMTSVLHIMIHILLIEAMWLVDLWWRFLCFLVWLENKCLPYPYLADYFSIYSVEREVLLLLLYWVIVNGKRKLVATFLVYFNLQTCALLCCTKLQTHLIYFNNRTWLYQSCHLSQYIYIHNVQTKIHIKHHLKEQAHSLLAFVWVLVDSRLHNIQM